MPGVIVGLDIGGSKIHAAVFDEECRPVFESCSKTGAGGGSAVIDTALSVLDKISRLIKPVSIAAIGIGVPGLVDPTKGSVRQAVNLGIGKVPVDIVTPIQAVHKVTCRVENDVNVAALGAYTILSRTVPITDLVYLSIGTGVAAGVILGGKIHRGYAGVSGEIGHFQFSPKGRRCGCGMIGCLEAVASGPAIARQWVNGDASVAAQELFKLAADGDPSAVEIAGRVADYLARSIYLLTITYDVEWIMLGGGVADAGRPLLDSIESALSRMADQSDFVRDINMPDRLLLRPDAPLGALGAATLAGF